MNVYIDLVSCTHLNEQDWVELFGFHICSTTQNLLLVAIKLYQAPSLVSLDHVERLPLSTCTCSRSVAAALTFEYSQLLIGRGKQDRLDEL